MNIFGLRRIRPDHRGGFQLRLPKAERQLLRQLPDELTTLLAAVGTETGAETPPVPDELRRLFPVAHPRDAAEEADYVAVARGELLRHHREALATLERTIDSTTLSVPELESWLAALNDLRLVIGTALGVTEEDAVPGAEDPDYPRWMCYGYLSFLVTEVVEALSGELGPPSDNDPAPEDPWGEPPGGLRWDGTPTPEG
ncbi:MAG: DUF2017 family protein [Actinomycetota bacterium]|nr:DUF2017 family protein [Actinomycetota bacterium]